jgi:membrane associated rhomboid family serine protease
LVAAWWFGAKRLDHDGDGDVDIYDVQAFLNGEAQPIRRNFSFKTPPPAPARGVDSEASNDTRPSTHSKILAFLDRTFGNADGQFGVDDILESAVDGKAEEGDVAEEMLSGQLVPWFITVQTSLAFALWFLFAVIHTALGIVPDFTMAKAGLDSLSPGWSDLRLYHDCHDYRLHLWRWFTYQFSHVGMLHVVMNCLFNVIFGIPMEGIHGTKKMAIMYNIGVFGGACCVFVASAHDVVVGMSGGCYSLVGMHLADLFMNWNKKRYRKLVVAFIFCLIGSDLWQFRSTQKQNVSNAAHFGGCVAGFCIGIVIGKNYKITRLEQYVRFGVCIFASLLAFIAFMWLVTNWPPRELWEPHGWCWYRQVLNSTILSDTWECVRCGNRSCAEAWVRTQANIYEVARASCSSRGWADTNDVIL